MSDNPYVFRGEELSCIEIPRDRIRLEVRERRDLIKGRLKERQNMDLYAARVGVFRFLGLVGTRINDPEPMA